MTRMFDAMRQDVRYAAVLLLLGVVAAVATVVPARRAGNVDPVIALRAD